MAVNKLSNKSSRSPIEITTPAELEVQSIKESVDLESANSRYTFRLQEQWGELGALADRYIDNGLVYMSASPTISNRDRNGNIILHEIIQNSEKTNQKLYIEPTVTYYSNRSVLRNIDTQFNYFEFPPIVNIVDTDVPTPNIDNITDQLLQDLINAKFIPDPNIKWFLFAPSYKLTDRSYGYQKLNFSTILNGIPQVEPSTYRITQELIDSGNDLQFRVKVSAHNQLLVGSLNRRGTIANIVYRMTLNLRAEQYRPTPANVPISRITIPPKGYDLLELVYTVKNSEMRLNDVWEVTGKADDATNGYYQSDQSFWEVTMVSPNSSSLPYGRVVTIETPIGVSEIATSLIDYIQRNRDSLIANSDITPQNIISGKLQQKLTNISQNFIDKNYSNTKITVENVFSYIQQQIVQSPEEIRALIEAGIAQGSKIDWKDLPLGPTWIVFKALT